PSGGSQFCPAPTACRSRRDFLLLRLPQVHAAATSSQHPAPRSSCRNPRFPYSTEGSPPETPRPKRGRTAAWHHRHASSLDTVLRTPIARPCFWRGDPPPACIVPFS